MKRLQKMPELRQRFARRVLGWLDTYECPDEAPLLLGGAFQTAMYSLGLLLRHESGDVEKAIRLLYSLPRYQYTDPAFMFYGTFRRGGENEAYFPPDGGHIWKTYDPNLREFVGLTLVVLISEYETALPEELVTKLESMLERAADGSILQPVPADYTNPCLMKAGFLDWLGHRLNREDYKVEASKVANAVVDLLRQTGSFDEFNSPDYYAIDLWSLSVWIEYGCSSPLREIAVELEETLWREIGDMYHAGFKNLCGPYDRTYSMDHSHGSSVLTAQIAFEVGEEAAPLIDLSDKVLENNMGFWLLPAVFHQQRVPVDVRDHLRAFQGERLVKKVAATQPVVRSCTAWLSETLMIGAQDSGSAKFASFWKQFVPASAHWRTENGDLCWMKLIPTLPINGRVEAGDLELWSYIWPGTGWHEYENVFEISVPNPSVEMVTKDQWNFPGLRISFETNADDPVIAVKDGKLEIRFTARHLYSTGFLRFKMRFLQVPNKQGTVETTKCSEPILVG